LPPALDPLTWLPNQPLFRARLQQVLAAAQSPRLALLHIDLDRFGDVNDLLGHDTGDQVLHEAAARIARAFPSGALLGYFGGDDFAVAVEASELARAIRLARALLETCREPFVVDCLSLRLTASVGIALRSKEAPDAGSLIANACCALYRAKVGGRDRCYPGRSPQQ
jgi:diguanylate cyclase (GGDEF)-like protein